MLLAALLLFPTPNPLPTHNASWRGGLEEIKILKGLALPTVSRYGRDPAPLDPIAGRIAQGAWQPPVLGEEVTGSDGRKQKWAEVKAGGDAAFSGPAMRGGMLYAAVDSPSQRPMILEAAGHSMVYVNGEPRAGDVYSFGYVKLPVLLKPGRNDFLFHAGRGRMTARLVAPKADAEFNMGDPTLPDIVDRNGPTFGGIVVMNSTEQPMSDLAIETSWPGKEPIGVEQTAVPSIPPMTSRKVRFNIPAPGVVDGETTRYDLKLLRGKTALDSASIELRVRGAKMTQKRTFVSDIDGSVQYYAVVPSTGTTPGATVVSLHGAGVEAIGQAEAYSAKDWATIVCPTNRRPYGFDWEDWGRLDALEVLRKFKEPYFLTGHSMGGHGTWQLGVTFPGLFAGIGPSAGWISFWTYAGGVRYSNQDPVERILARAASPADTASLAKNLLDTPVYILHGDADDNVPVTEARAMRDLFQSMEKTVEYHEQKGAGHWWDVSPEPGADCVDWNPMFQMFKQELASRDFDGPYVRLSLITSNPAVSSKNNLVRIERQIEPMKLSSARVDSIGQRQLVATTDNVEVLTLEVAHRFRPTGTFAATIDGQLLPVVKPPPPNTAWVLDGPPFNVSFERKNGQWRQISFQSGHGKNPVSSGPFKNAFKNRMIFVYGTKGTAEENAWASAKARFDAETFWYRGNGAVDVLPDIEYDAKKHAGRNVILYGHSASNAAWGKLLKNSPLQVNRGWLKMGARVVRGSNLAALFVRPLGKDSLVGVVSGTGPIGMRLSDRLPYFVSGVAYPDWTIMTPELLKSGSKGIVGAGFFGNDWGYSAANSAWR